MREMAVRLGMDASRGRLVRLLIAESLLLALTGGAVGLGLAYADVAVLRVTSPPGLPCVNAIAVDARALLVTLAMSAASRIFFGLALAFLSARDSRDDALKESGRGGMKVVRPGASVTSWSWARWRFP